MKIERVEVFGVAVPLIGEYKNAYRSKSIQKSAIVRITASGGAVGLGSGSLALPAGPGLGVMLDQAKLDRYRFEVKAAA